MKRGRFTTECMFSCEGERHKNCNVKGVHYVRVVFSFCLDLVTKLNTFKDISGYGVVITSCYCSGLPFISMLYYNVCSSLKLEYDQG